MKSSWTKGLSKEEAANVKGEYSSSPSLRLRVRQMLDEKMDSTKRKERSKEDLDNPNWAIKQAYHLGYEKAIEEILNLFSD